MALSPLVIHKLAHPSAGNLKTINLFIAFLPLDYNFRSIIILDGEINQIWLPLFGCLSGLLSLVALRCQRGAVFIERLALLAFWRRADEYSRCVSVLFSISDHSEGRTKWVCESKTEFHIGKAITALWNGSLVDNLRDLLIANKRFFNRQKFVRILNRLQTVDAGNFSLK